MDSCRQITNEMLSQVVMVKIDEELLDFDVAKRAAADKAKEIAEDPMLLAWYDRKVGRYSPDVECCGEEKPAWMVYAESRGGNIIINVNSGDYIFIYADFHEPPGGGTHLPAYQETRSI